MKPNQMFKHNEVLVVSHYRNYELWPVGMCAVEDATITPDHQQTERTKIILALCSIGY